MVASLFLIVNLMPQMIKQRLGEELQVQCLIFQPEHISYSLERDFSVNHIQSFRQRRVVFACLLPAFVSQCEGITLRGVRQGEGRGVGNRTRDISHALVDDTVDAIIRLAVSRRT